MDPIQQLIQDYGDQIGLPGLILPSDGALTLDFEDDLQIHLDQLDEKLVIFSQIGLLGDGEQDKLEMLLSANLMWRDTDGATLSMDPYSRAVILAKNYSSHDIDSVYKLSVTLDQFCHLTQTWRQALA